MKKLLIISILILFMAGSAWGEDGSFVTDGTIGGCLDNPECAKTMDPHIEYLDGSVMRIHPRWHEGKLAYPIIHPGLLAPETKEPECRWEMKSMRFGSWESRPGWTRTSDMSVEEFLEQNKEWEPVGTSTVNINRQAMPNGMWCDGCVNDGYTEVWLKREVCE